MKCKKVLFKKRKFVKQCHIRKSPEYLQNVLNVDRFSLTTFPTKTDKLITILKNLKTCSHLGLFLQSGKYIFFLVKMTLIAAGTVVGYVDVLTYSSHEHIYS